MNSQTVNGKTVKKVHQRFWKAEEGCHTPCWVVERIEFTNGTSLMFNVVEGEAEYGVEAIVRTALKQKGLP